MIPKIIHYCWMSEDEYPLLIQKCINSWKEKLPDYEFVKWDAEKFNINITRYTQEAFIAKKYPFVSDYIRLYALYHYGGIYLDSDIEVLKSFNELLDNKAFTGFEDDDLIAMWILGSEKNNPIFLEMMSVYDNISFKRKDGSYNLTPNTVLLTPILNKNGVVNNNTIQKNDLITVYTKDYFCPKNYKTGEIIITKNTYSIHYFNGSWLSEIDKIRHKQYQILRKYIGNFFAYNIVMCIKTYQEKGALKCLKKIIKKIL